MSQAGGVAPPTDFCDAHAISLIGNPHAFWTRYGNGGKEAAT